MRRAAELAAIVLLAVLLAGWFVQRGEGNAAADAADAARARGDRVEAIVQGRRAAMARCPGCAGPTRGYGILEQVAREAESKSDDAMAVAAWRAIRAATLGTMVLDPESPRRSAADTQIARLEHRLDMAGAAAGGQAAPAATEARIQTALAMPTMPSTALFLVLAAAAAVFALGAMRFVRTRPASPKDAALALAGILGAAAGVLLF